MRTSLPKADQKLVQIVDAALVEAARKSGEWLVCRKGCTQCCYGTFAISQLDALRLQKGLHDLKSSDPKRAARVRQRAQQAVKQLSANFPGDPKTGILGEDEEAEAAFADFGNDEPCPALDPVTGACDLYDAPPYDLPHIWAAGAVRPRGRPGCLRIVLSRRNRSADCRL